MRRVLLAGLVAAFASFAGSSEVGSIAQVPSGKSDAKPIVLSMELFASRPVVRIGVNEKGPFAFLISPEAETTLVDRMLADELNLKSKDRASGGASFEVALDLASTKLTVPVALTDVAQLVPEFGAAARPRGVISVTVWKEQLVTLDYPRWRVSIEPGALPDADERAVFRLTPSREFIIPLAAGERSVPCRVDPLFSGGILVPASFVKELKTVGKSMPPRTVNTRTGPIDVQETQLAVSAKLGGFELLNPILQVSDRLPNAMVSGQTLAGFSITYDLTNGRARLERQKGSAGRN
jgi:hypothetical protein